MGAQEAPRRDPGGSKTPNTIENQWLLQGSVLQARSEPRTDPGAPKMAPHRGVRNQPYISGRVEEWVEWVERVGGLVGTWSVGRCVGGLVGRLPGVTLLSLLSMFSRSPQGSLLPLLVAAWWLLSPLSPLTPNTMSPVLLHNSVHTSGGIISSGGAVPAI